MMTETDCQQIIDRVIDHINGTERECSHWARHTVYGSDDPKRNGTWCQVCGEKLR